MAFYRGLFGWDFEDVMPAGAAGKYFIARLHGGDVAAVGSHPEGGSPASWSTYVWVESADEAASKVRSAGGRVVTEPFDVIDGGRTAVFTDPDGAAAREVSACTLSAGPRESSRQKPMAAPCA